MFKSLAQSRTRLALSLILLLSPVALDTRQSGAAPHTRAQTLAQAKARGDEQPEEEPKDISDAYVREDSLKLNGYVITKHEKKVWYHYPRETKLKPDLLDATYAVLKRGGRVLAKFDGAYSGFGNATDFGAFPFLGGASRQLAVSLTVPRGGRHWVVDLGRRPRVIFDSGDYEVGREELSVIDIDKDGTYEISMPVTAFYMFGNMSMAETPLPEIVFKYDARARKYVPANQRFPDYVLRGIDEDIAKLREDDVAYLSKRLDVLLRYVYAGREREGWDFFERAYTRADRAAIKRKIMSELRRETLYRLLYPKSARL